MKLFRLFLLAILLAFIYFSCKKDSDQEIIFKSQDPFVANGISWIKNNVTTQEFDQLDFSRVSTITNGRESISAEIFLKGKSSNRFVFLSKDENGYTGNWVEHLPLNNNVRSTSEGIIKTESFDGSFKSELTFIDNKPAKYVRTVNGETKIVKVSYGQPNSLNSGRSSTTEIGMGVQAREMDDQNVLPPVTVTTYINNSYTSLYSLFYYNPAAMYRYSYTMSTPTDGASSYAPSYSYTIIVAAPATESYKIGNVADYFKCFTNVAGSTNTYRVTICVDQPKPGTRDPWGFSGDGTSNSSSGANPINVGHTFLIFTETTPTQTITRNIGFYPSTMVKPTLPEAQGQVMNNDDHAYNISLSVTMTNSEFFNILNFVSQGNNIGYNYNLSNNNCTTFTLNALASAGIFIKSSSGSWPNGQGKNPGDFGEDIRSMSLPSNMTRSTTSTSHPNIGSCYY